MVNGYYYWKGDVISHPGHPPFPKVLQALPLRALDLRDKTTVHFDNPERRAYNFFFVLNPDQCISALALARGVSFLLGIGVGLLLLWTSQGESIVFLLTTLTLWAFEPNLLAFSGVAMADIPVTFFFLAALLCFRWFQKKPTNRRAFFAGLVGAMALTSKYSAGVLAPIFLLLGLFGREGVRRETGGESIVKGRGFAWLMVFAGVILWIGLIYLPGTLVIPGHLSPYRYFWEGFRGLSGYSGYATYFWGELSHQNHLFYFPLAILLKSPPALLILAGLGVALALLGKIKIPLWQWMSPLVLYLAVMPFANIGIREILPIYPFLILVAARGGQWLWNRTSSQIFFRAGLVLLLDLQALNVALAFPAHVSYFNPLVGMKSKLFYLGDSNLDLGQDTRRLSQAATRFGWKHVKLAYMGACDPAFYGMDWSYWTEQDLKGPQPGWVYAVNASFLQLGPAFIPGANPILASWITRVAPTKKIGSTWLCYEIPGKAFPDRGSPLASAPPFAYFEALGRGLPKEEARIYLPKF